MATEWYCKIMGEEWGPMSSQELLAVAQRGRLTRDDTVRRGNRGTWVRAELVGGLFKAPATAPTATTGHLAVSPKQPAPAKRSMRSVLPGKYWIKVGRVGRKAAGPFCARQIREFAEIGVLKPTHLVSNDRRHWSPAGHINGLVFGGARAEAETVSIRSAILIDRPACSPNDPTLDAVTLGSLEVGCAQAG
jgi:hypothetical protein